MPATSYAIGLGANRGRPRRMLARALAALRAEGIVVIAVAPTVESMPLGPGTRRYINSAALVVTMLDPPALLALVKRIERDLGRRPGRRWGDRAIDIDLLLWSGGRWRSAGLDIPHPRLAQRSFVLGPLSAIASDWQMPGRAIAVRHLARRLTAARPLHRQPGERARSSVGRATDF